eukprot:14770653-Alexandrium_andersonii.AAC.1
MRRVAGQAAARPSVWLFVTCLFGMPHGASPGKRRHVADWMRIKSAVSPSRHWGWGHACSVPPIHSRCSSYAPDHHDANMGATASEHTVGSLAVQMACWPAGAAAAAAVAATAV